jgi:hypothetical protein
MPPVLAVHAVAAWGTASDLRQDLGMGPAFTDMSDSRMVAAIALSQHTMRFRAGENVKDGSLGQAYLHALAGVTH